MELNVQVQATQWFKAGDHSDVHELKPRLIKRGDVGYLTGIYPLASCWVSLDKLAKPITTSDAFLGPTYFQITKKDGESYYRSIWTFAFWDMNGPVEEVGVATTDDFFLDAVLIEHTMASVRNKNIPADYVLCGSLNRPDSKGRSMVYPGMWIVDIGDIRTLMDDQTFQRTYGKQLCPSQQQT